MTALWCVSICIEWKRNFATKIKEMRRRQGRTRKGEKSKNYQCGYMRRRKVVYWSYFSLLFFFKENLLCYNTMICNL
ncbi:hypothetical protein AAZV13_14G133600 [Glycine max]